MVTGCVIGGRLLSHWHNRRGLAVKIAHDTIWYRGSRRRYGLVFGQRAHHIATPDHHSDAVRRPWPSFGCFFGMQIQTDYAGETQGATPARVDGDGFP
jgi:hypothetical protein